MKTKSILVAAILFLGLGVASGRRKRRMKRNYFVLAAALLVGLAVLSGCGAPSKPKDALTVAELLENPVYGTEVKVYGEVSLLGELFCPCFELASEGQTVQVWYELMVEDDGTEWPAASVEGIQNGDQVVVTGELQQAGTHSSLNDLWATQIERVDG